jgi:hypothetical protein
MVDRPLRFFRSPSVVAEPLRFTSTNAPFSMRVFPPSDSTQAATTESDSLVKSFGSDFADAC